MSQAGAAVGCFQARVQASWWAEQRPGPQESPNACPVPPLIVCSWIQTELQQVLAEKRAETSLRATAHAQNSPMNAQYGHLPTSFLCACSAGLRVSDTGLRV